MKHLILATFLSSVSLSAYAAIPQDLLNLIPVGEKEIILEGRTDDQLKCRVGISSVMDTFVASLRVLDANSQVIAGRFAKFQVGFGHELKSLGTKNNTLVGVAIHNAEESYSSDSRNTLKVNSDSKGIKAIQVINEQKLFFMYTKKANEICRF